MSARIASRLAWACVGLTVVLIVAGAVLVAAASRQSLPPDLAHLPGWFELLSPLYAIAFSIVGALIASRRPENRVGWVCCAIGLLSALSIFTTHYAGYARFVKPRWLPVAEWLVWLQSWDFSLTFALIVVFLPLLFPNGRLPSPRWRLVAWLAALGIVLQLAAAVLGAERAQGLPYSNFRNPLGMYAPVAFLSRLISLAGVLSLPAYLLGPLSVVVRFRRAGPEERQQLKWVTTAVALMMIVILAAIVIGSFILHTIPVQVPVLDILVPLSVISLPVAIGIAVLNYRLYDIDVVINKALVYGALAGFITAVYVGIVAGIGALIGRGGEPNLALSILATAIVAIAFQPVRERVQRVANRVVYGKRATPYEVMADFSDRMAGALSVEEVLPRMAEAAARGVGAQRSQVQLFLPDRSTRLVSWPAEAGSDPFQRILPVSHRGEPVGQIAIAKAAGDPLTPAEDKLLADLAAQAGLVLHNVRLTVELQARLTEISAQAAELRASRQRIVSAQDAMRRRLEQTIRSGVERELSSVCDGLGVAEQQLDRDASKAAVTLDELTAQTNEILEGLRDLARGIYPPLLRDKGLAAALKAQAAKMPMSVEIISDGVERYPSEVEAAVYFCCLEALRGLGGQASIHLGAADDSLVFTVAGSGLVLDGRLQDIEDRVEALGGTVAFQHDRLFGRVPARILEPA